MAQTRRRKSSRAPRRNSNRRRSRKITPTQRRCISEKIPILIKEGRPQRQSIAIAYSICGVKRK